MIFMQSIIKILQSKNSTKVTKNTFRKYIYDGIKYKIELENEDNDFLINSIFKDQDTPLAETSSQKRVLYAKKYFEKELSNQNLEVLERLLDVLTYADLFIYIVDDFSNAVRIFELIHSRGTKRKNIEILSEKSDFIS